jgi:hypothetical protein
MCLAAFLTAFLRITVNLLLGSFVLIEFLRLLEQRANREAIWRIITDTITVCIAFALPFLASTLLLPSGGESYFAQYSTTSLQTIQNFSVAYFYLFGEFFGKSAGQTYLYYFGYFIP